LLLGERHELLCIERVAAGTVEQCELHLGRQSDLMHEGMDKSSSLLLRKR